MGEDNFYAGVALDRAAEMRGDEAWLSERLQDRASRFLPVWRFKHLVREAPEPRARLLSRDALGAALDTGAEVTLLGLSDGAAHFAVDLSHLEEAAVEALADGDVFRDLRSVGPLLPRADAALLAYARGLAYWHSRHRFCGVCGAPAEAREAGHLRRCTRAECAAAHFPRTDPAVIMLVTRGAFCLLGRQSRWPDGMYSTLAGFVEPGESLEEAVAREVKEETGVSVGEVRYHSSQPWPFPSSLMLGFRARAESEEIVVDRDELADAGWYDREAVRRAAEGGASFRLPPPVSIARRLIDGWVEGRDDETRGPG